MIQAHDGGLCPAKSLIAVGMPLQRKMLGRTRSALKLSYIESQPIFRIPGLVETLFEQRLDVLLCSGPFDRVEAGTVFVDGFMRDSCVVCLSLKAPRERHVRQPRLLPRCRRLRRQLQSRIGLTQRCLAMEGCEEPL